MRQRPRVRVDSPRLNNPESSIFRMPPPRPDVPEGKRPTLDQSYDLPSNGRDDSQPQGELEGVYIISVAARILDMHPQTLRKYERLGLINPGRTVGMLRLYSHDDIRKVLLIRHLMENLGLNLAGVEFALNLVDNLHGFKQYLESVAKGTKLEPIVEPAMAQLFRNLNLPAEE